MKKKKINKGSKIQHPKTKFKTKDLLTIFAEHKGKALGVTSLMNKLKIQKAAELMEQLDLLTKKKLLLKVSPGKWAINEPKDKIKGKSQLYEGVVDMARAGFAYILCKGIKQDIFVSARNLATAQDGDVVKVQMDRLYTGRPEGKVVEILHRSKTQFVGVYREHKNHKLVVVAQGQQFIEIQLQAKSQHSVKDFDKVIVEITHWPERRSDTYRGKILKVLGADASVEMEMETILAEQGFLLEFSPTAIEESEAMPDEITDIDQRRDFRDLLSFTIDPVDAKDFDDALSVSYNLDGQLEIGVHIADVSYYVKENSALDKEALKRGNSVYLVDRVVPMLPERLSNELCSLRPNEDKACFAVVFTFNEKQEIIHHWIGRTVIHSQRRFAYEEVQAILDQGRGELHTELNLLNTLAKKIKKERLAHGAIDFDSEEVRFKLDENKKPVELYVKQRFDAHMLIEEFMLLANKFVANFMVHKNENKPIPFVYRIHDLPDESKLEDFMLFAKEMGIKMDFSSPTKIAKSLNYLADQARQKEELRFLLPMAIRTMAKAEYSPENIGHYGLGFENYTHFTSPIRRYSDLMVHRILFANLHKEKRFDLGKIDLECLHISSQERKAMEAERESTKYFQTVYMQEFIGKVFDARITGMNDRNFYVEILESKCECSIALNAFEDGIIVEKSRMIARSSLTEKTYKIGSRVKVKITSAYPEDREVCGQLVEE